MSAAVVSVPADEGVNTIKERDDPGIVTMALKIKENNRKNEVTQQQVPTTVYINRASSAVHLPSTKVSHFNKAEKNVNPVKLIQNCEDSKSIKGKFVWRAAESCYLPCLIRKINDTHLELVSVRIAEKLLLGTYMSVLDRDFYAYVSVKSQLMLESEANLLNDINRNHTKDQAFGEDPFIADKECLVSMTDVEEFFKFLEVCYHKLMCAPLPGFDKFGFIRINFVSVVPFCSKDNQKYVPLFYFEGETENLQHRAITLNSWDLAYLKFCCKVQGIKNELFASDSCSVTSLEDIKAYFPPDTHFEEYWPAKVAYVQQISMQKSKTTPLGNSGSWIKAPPSKISNLSIPENNKHSLQAPIEPMASPITPMSNSTYQNRLSPNQIVHSYNIQTQPTQTHSYHALSRNQNVPAQYNNVGLMVQQQKGFPMNNSHVPLPPLIRSVNVSTSVISNLGSYRNVTSMNQPITPVYGQITNSCVITHSNQLKQLYATQCPNNSVHQQQQLQQHHQQHLNALPIPQYNVSFLSSNEKNGKNSHVSNTQQHNTLRNIITAPATEIIDLLSPPSSPAPPTIPETNVRNRAMWNLIRVPERQIWGGIQDTTNHDAYQIQTAIFQGKTIHCINAKEYVHNANLMVSVEDLVKTIIPSSSVSRFLQILQKYFQTSVYCGNSEQIAMLHKNGHLRSMSPDDSPLVMLQDITQVWLQLITMSKLDEQVQQYQQSWKAATNELGKWPVTTGTDPTAQNRQ